MLLDFDSTNNTVTVLSLDVSLMNFKTSDKSIFCQYLKRLHVKLKIFSIRKDLLAWSLVL